MVGYGNAVIPAPAGIQEEREVDLGEHQAPDRAGMTRKTLRLD